MNFICPSFGIAQTNSNSNEIIGKLLLLGGGITENHANLIKRFSGGDSAQVVVIPTAMSDDEISKDPSFSKVYRRMERLGFDNIIILHTRDRSKANSEEFFAPLTTAGGVLILGGSTPRLLDAYDNTKTLEAIKALYRRGGIVAGVSAGSGVIGSFFYKKQLEKGFELLQNVVIMNHFLVRGKQFDHVEEIKANQDRVAIGIDDNTGILVHEDRFEVVGKSYVAIYDQSYYDRSRDSIYALPKDTERFYLLKNGERYNLKDRTVETNSRLEPISLSLNQVLEYVGSYKAQDKDFGIEFQVANGTLFVKNSWGWSPYPIYPFEKDVFFATNRNMWFQFYREKGVVIRVEKMRSILQSNVINTLIKE